MSQHAETPPIHLVDTNLGPVEVRDEGSGPAVLLSHAALTNHDLWGGLTRALAPDHRVIRATLPMGAHRLPAGDRSRLVLPHLADALVEVLDAQGVDRAAVVGVDTGGAVAQVVTARHPERVQGLFLFSCDAFENFPPKLFRPVCALLRLPATSVLLAGYRLRVVQEWAGARLVTKHGLSPELMRSFFHPMAKDRDIRDDTAALLAQARRGTLSAFTSQLAAYDGPVRIAWSRKDPLFPAEDGERLAALFPQAELSFIDDARAFAMLDQPALSHDLVRTFITDHCR